MGGSKSFFRESNFRQNKGKQERKEGRKGRRKEGKKLERNSWVSSVTLSLSNLFNQYFVSTETYKTRNHLSCPCFCLHLLLQKHYEVSHFMPPEANLRPRWSHKSCDPEATGIFWKEVTNIPVGSMGTDGCGQDSRMSSFFVLFFSCPSRGF